MALNGENFVDVMGKLKDGNTFLEVRGGQSVYHFKDVSLVEDCGYFDKTCKRMQELKKEGRSIGGCYRECSLAECVEQQEWFLDSENSVDARLQIEESIDPVKILDSEGSCIGAVTRSNMKQLKTKQPNEARGH